MEEAGDMTARVLGILSAHGPLTTGEVTERLLRDGLDAGRGEVHNLLTQAALRGLVKVGSRSVAGIARVSVWDLALRQVLCWDKPERAESYEEWARYQADSAPPGTWAPNMSDAWKARWKARMHGQRTPGMLRVEVRKSAGIYRGGSVQVKVVVGEDGSVTMSMNGTAELTRREFTELHQAVAEARAAIENWKAEEKVRQALPGHAARTGTP